MEQDGLRLYERLLRLGSDWSVTEIRVNDPADLLDVYVRYNKTYRADPQSGEIFPIHDLRSERVWRHLDSMEHKTFIHCRLPRVKRADGSYHTIEIEWAESGISHTKKFENKCLETLQCTHNQSAAAQLMSVSDDRICSMMHSGVERGLAKRDVSQIKRISIDEKSYQKGHVYASVLYNADTGDILDLVRERTQSAATELLHKVFNVQELLEIQACCCDMWEAFINALKKTVLTLPLRTINFT